MFSLLSPITFNTSILYFCKRIYRKMSLLKWLKKSVVQQPGLPNPLDEVTVDRQNMVASTNKAVMDEMPAAATTNSEKRGDYQVYDSSLRARIGNYETQHGTVAATCHFEQELKCKLLENTIRNIKRKYVAATMQTGGEITDLPTSSRGRPCALGEDNESVVKKYILKLCKAGGTVNSSILIAAASGILTHRHPSILKTNGGHVELGRNWAKSFMKRLGLVKRKGTQAARKLPSNFARFP